MDFWSTVKLQSCPEPQIFSGRMLPWVIKLVARVCQMLFGSQRVLQLWRLQFRHFWLWLLLSDKRLQLSASQIFNTLADINRGVDPSKQLVPDYVWCLMSLHTEPHVASSVTIVNCTFGAGLSKHLPTWVGDACCRHRENPARVRLLVSFREQFTSWLFVWSRGRLLQGQSIWLPVSIGSDSFKCSWLSEDMMGPFAHKCWAPTRTCSLVSTGRNWC